jgi:hypothetical protein
MTSVSVVVGSENFGAALRRVEVFVDGPVGSWCVVLRDAGGASGIARVGQGVVLSINDSVVMRGFVDDKLPEVVNSYAVYDRVATVEGLNVAMTLVCLMVKAKFIDVLSVSSLCCVVGG